MFPINFLIIFPTYVPLPIVSTSKFSNHNESITGTGHSNIRAVDVVGEAWLIGDDHIVDNDMALISLISVSKNHLRYSDF